MPDRPLSNRDAARFRVPMPVTSILLTRTSQGALAFPVCPRCQISLEREYQAYCDRCGQALDWGFFEQATVLPAEP